MAITPNIAVIAWAPDADPTTPGVLVDVENMVPTQRGYAPEFALGSPYSTTTLPSECSGAGLLEFANGDSVLMIATATKIYSSEGNGLNDKSRVSGAYTSVGPYESWRFAAWENTVLACHRFNAMQVSTAITTTPLSDLSGAPRAATIAVNRNFVIVADLYDPVIQRDGWACSALEDYTDWTPDIATQSATGRLTSTPGQILRLISFRDNVIAFKERGVYRGTYVGAADNTWAWPVVSTEIGLVSHDAVCEADGVLYWLGRDGFFRWAGGTIERIASAPWNWLRARLNMSTIALWAQAVFDPVRRVVRWVLETISLASDRTVLTYHIDTDRWGRATLPVQWVFQYGSGPSASLESASRIWFKRVPGYVRSTDRVLVTHLGEPGDSTFTTGDIGDDDQALALTKTRVRFLSAPSSSYVEHAYRMDLGDPLQQGEVAQRTDGKYDISHAARWHRLRFTQTGRYEVTGFSVEMPKAGRR